MGVREHGTSTEYFSSLMQHACTLDEVRAAYLDSIGEVMRSKTFALYQLDPQTGEPEACTAHAPDRFLDEYEQYGRRDDPVLRGAVEQAGPVNDELATAPDEWRSSGAYAVLSRSGFVHSLEAPVIVGDATVATLNFARTEHEPGFGARELRQARWASKLVSAALYRAARFEATGDRVRMLTDVIESLDTALVISSLDGEQLYLNDAAQRSVSGQQRSLAQLAAPALEDNVAAIRSDATRAAASSYELPTSQGHATARSIRLQQDPSMVLTFLELKPAQHNPSVAALSPRELEIAELVARGLTTGQMSRELFISQNTVKQHLKRMFQKVNVHNRAQLVAQLWNPEDTARTDTED